MKIETSDNGAAAGVTLPGLKSFSDILREGTKSLHVKAERSGIIADILHGRVNRYGYALLLRNLLPAYRALEEGLNRHRGDPVLGIFANQALYRAPALANDLQALFGVGWAESLPLLQAGEEYGERVAQAGRGDGMLLIGHAYARYLGDLSGGQILRRLLGKTLNLEPEQLTFYNFPNIPDLDAFKRLVKAALDRLPVEHASAAGILSEASVAFELNIAVSEAVQTAIAT